MRLKRSSLVAQPFTDSASPGTVNVLLSELLVEILDVLPDKGPQLVQTEGEPASGPAYGRGFATVRIRTAPWN